jgi:uncharacterized protein YbjT (DUF2867 family)
MTTILVTGATGNVGAHVVRELRNRGVTVRAFVRNVGKGSVTLGADVELVTGDFTNGASLETAMRGADGMFIATPNHPRQAELEHAVIDAAAAGGVRRVVKLSSIGAAIGAPLEFWNAQGRCESHVRATLPNAVILRSNFYMTNLLGAAERVKTLGKMFAPAGEARIAMVDPRDVATVAATLLTSASHAGQTMTVTGPEAITYSRIAETLSVVSGKPVEFVNVPDEAARQAMIGAGMPEWIAGNLVQLFSLLRAGAGAEITTTFRDVTGREPRSFADFARDHAPMFCR